MRRSSALGAPGLRMRQTSVLLILGALAAQPMGTRAVSAQGARDLLCADAHRVVSRELGELSRQGTRSVQRSVDSSILLYRFHRAAEGAARLDATVRLLDASWSRLMSPAEREAVSAAMGALRACVTESVAPPLATLTVRTLELAGGSPDARWIAATPGAVVRVDDVPIGRTGAGGLLTAAVPSGAIRVTAVVPPSSLGSEDIVLPAGGTGSVSVRLDPDKEVTEVTTLVVAEAAGGVLSRDAASITLRFTEDGRPVRMRRIDAVDTLDGSGDVRQDLKHLFVIVDGEVRARDPRTAIAQIRGTAASGRLVLRVQTAGVDLLTYANTIEFRID